MGLIRTSQPDAIVTVTDVKDHLRIDGTEDDRTLPTFIAAATEYVEGETGQALAEADYTLTLDSFPIERSIPLPRPPLKRVNAVTYTDTDGQTQTLPAAAYTVDDANRPGRLVLKPGHAWPTTTGEANSVRVDFTAGPETLPFLLRQAVLLMTGHFFEFREAAGDRRVTTVPLAVESICDQHRFTEVQG
ncbi:MAG: head-tail connector protein [Planctomycetota bacterium]